MISSRIVVPTTMRSNRSPSRPQWCRRQSEHTNVAGSLEHLVVAVEPDVRLVDDDQRHTFGDASRAHALNGADDDRR